MQSFIEHIVQELHIIIAVVKRPLYTIFNKVFVTIPADHANSVLQTNQDAIYSEWGSFDITDFAASTDCNLIIVTGEGING